MKLELKDVLFCALNAEKDLTNLYNLAANESLNQELAEEFLSILCETHEAKYDIFSKTYEKGFFSTNDADEKKANEIKTKFTNKLMIK